MNGSPDLSLQIGKLLLKNPVIPASGTFGYGQEYEQFFDLNRLGAVITKTITPKPRIGSFPHRLTEVPSGSLATIGLQNVGIDRFIEEKLPYFESLEVPLIISLGAETIDDYTALTKKVDRQKRINAIELNVSCPNVKKGGMHFGVDLEVIKELVTGVREATNKTLIVKLTPMVTDIRPFAEISQQCGADGISLINGLVGMAIDIEKRKSKLGRNISGGLSGPAIKPVALRMVWLAAQTVDIPIIGIGGISSPEDAIEFLIAGASAIQIGTYNFVDPTITIRVIEGIEAYMNRKNIDKLSSLIGSLEV
jgi:dihydroorotate dehydrogenase (NAD+) catalytic subunit